MKDEKGDGNNLANRKSLRPTIGLLTRPLTRPLGDKLRALRWLGVANAAKERTVDLQIEVAERERLQQKVIDAQKHALKELSSPIIPLIEGIIVMPLIGRVDSKRARDITRTLLVGIGRYQAKVVILYVTGVPILDSGVANRLNKTIRAAHLNATQTIITGISEAVAETIIDLGIDRRAMVTLSDLQTGLRVALAGITNCQSYVAATLPSRNDR